MSRLDRVLQKTQFYQAFYDSQKERYEKKIAANRESGRNVRRIKRIQSKISSVQNQTISNLLEIINKTKDGSQITSSKWHEVLSRVHLKNLEPEIEQEKEKKISKVVTFMRKIHDKQKKTINDGSVKMKEED